MLRTRISCCFFLFFFCFAAALLCEAAPGATVISRGVENAYGELPEIDGFSDLLLQEKINAATRKAAQDLQKAVQGKPELEYSYKIVCNTRDFLSIMLRAESGGVFAAARSVNIHLPSGADCAFGEIFNTSEEFFAALEESLGWRPDPDAAFALSGRGAVFVSPAGGLEQLVGYEKLFSWINISRAGHYLDSYRVTAAADGKLLRVGVGNMVVLFLEANRTSGYSWQIKKDSPSPVLQYINSAYLMNSPKAAERRIGAGGWEMLVFGVAAPGETYLEAEYKRPWENQAAKAIKIQIIGE
ncbi:MAG: protease inhibitor I42 family protein [Acidaminococcales bacterium]|jgi:predicted secreted protein|nr:protease inhibitor I42 family protein [Acidaminococcales bacterium]